MSKRRICSNPLIEVKTMTRAPRFEPIQNLAIIGEALRAEALEEDFGFVERLIAEWDSGVNRFDQQGEVLLGAFRGTHLVAIGGLNRDPYADDEGVGRLRHIYVKPSDRRSGVGFALVRHLLGDAEKVFRVVRLKTETPDAAAFYVALGFRPIRCDTATHAVHWRTFCPVRHDRL